MAEVDRALALARKLAALPEAQMRERVLAALLSELEPEMAAPVLAEFLARGRSGGPPFNVALRTLVGLLGRGMLPYETEASLYREARERGDEALMQMFYSGAELEPSERVAAEPQRELTLGHRKALARSRDPAVLQRLMLDPEPPVIGNLLENPRITEEDVIRLAARRPTDAEVQRQIASSRRWASRYRVKRALVLNPFTPLELSIRLLGFLNSGDLSLVRSSPTMSERLRSAAERLAAERS